MGSAGNAPIIHCFETSAAIIERAGWNIQNPLSRGILDVAGAQDFIKNPPVRDKRRNLDENRFRLLFVQLQDWSQLCSHKTLVKTAEDSGWISSESVDFIEKGTVGSAVLTRTGNTSLILQTPRDDLPFVTLSITELHAEGRQNGFDWVCLLFAASDINLESLLCADSFPSDYAPLSPDFMFLPAGILKWQVEQTRDRLAILMEDVIKEEKNVISRAPQILNNVKITLFELGKAHLKLRNRWLFERELAKNIARCFDEIVRRQSKDSSTAIYSKTLQQRVETQANLSMMLQHDFDTIPSKIKAQHQMIDAGLSIMIAQNSAIAAEEARRDGSSMKTIAVLTLLFLPATTIASIFSMSMFNWQANDGETIVSKQIWLYFVIAIPLTLVVLVFWILWFSWTQRRHQNRGGSGIENAIIPNSK